MIDPGRTRLLIHHHAVAHFEGKDEISLPSFFGRWVDALAMHFGQVCLLLHQTAERSTTRQDYRVSRENVRLISLGPPGRSWDRIARMRRIRKACLAARQNADGLLIRGITPRQYSVSQWVDLPQTAYLLVGTLRPNVSPRLRMSFGLLYEAYMRIHRRRELQAIARKALMLANSPGLADEIQRDFGVPANFVPTNTISAADFPPPRDRSLSEPLRLLFCGRVVVEKGILELVQALGLLVQQGVDATADIVGPITDEMRDEVVRTAQRAGVSGRVALAGPVEYGPALFSFYTRADIFVLPTYHEGFPHAIWEAAAHSCPVVTCGVGGIPALFEHEKHGLLTAPRNPTTVSDAIVRLISDGDLRMRLVHAAYGRAQEFTVEACAEKLSNILAERWG